MRNVISCVLVIFLTGFFAPPSEARLVPRRSVLQSGLILLTSEERALPMVTLSLLIDAGSRYDPRDREGLANITARLLTYGTRKRSALQISEALDFIGASLQASAGLEVTSISLTILKKDLDTGLELLGEILTASIFPPKEIERQRQSIIAAINARDENPGDIAQRKFAEALFPKSPYGRPVEGTPESIRNTDRKHIVDFYENFYRPERAIVAVVGDISHQEVTDRLSKALQSWTKGGLTPPPPPAPTPGPATTIRIQKNLTQSNIILGHEGVVRGDPDFYAIQVMNYVLGGGGFSSRLMDSVRSEKGLAYSVYSAFGAEKYTGTFQIVMQTKNESADEAMRIAQDEIRRIREQGVTDEELRSAKDYLTGSFPLRLDTNRKVAEFLANVEYFGLGLSYPDRYPELIRRIGQPDVHQAARRHLQPDKLITVVVGNPRNETKK